MVERVERVKVVVRNLPPPLSEEAFKEAVGKPFVDRAVWMAYHQGKNGCVRPSLDGSRTLERVLEEGIHTCTQPTGQARPYQTLDG
jgi:hypothetical protein